MDHNALIDEGCAARHRVASGSRHVRQVLPADHPTPFVTPKMRNTFGRLLIMVRDNLLPSIVKARTDRLRIDHFDTAAAAATDRRRLGRHTGDAFACWSSAEWPQHSALLRGTAEWLADMNRQFGVPLRTLEHAQLRDGVASVTTHTQINRVWHPRPHRSGCRLPRDVVLELARKIANPDPKPAVKPAAGKAYYTVRGGDTPGRIAGRYGTTVSKLTKWNGISNPNRIRVGQRLRVRCPRMARWRSRPVRLRDTTSNLPRAPSSCRDTGMTVGGIQGACSSPKSSV